MQLDFMPLKATSRPPRTGNPVKKFKERSRKKEEERDERKKSCKEVGRNWEKFIHIGINTTDVQIE